MARDDDAPEVLQRFHNELDLVDIVARQVGRTVGHGFDVDELRSFAREGLLDASRRFDASRGVPFRAYANFRVRGAIIDGIRSMTRLSRRAHERLAAMRAASLTSEGAAEDTLATKPVGTSADAERKLAEHMAALATAMAVGLLSEPAVDDGGEPTAVSTADDPEESASRKELLNVVREALSDLPQAEAALVGRHYLGGERFDEVAKDLGLSKSWASRLHTRAMARLTRRLRGASD